MFYASLIAIANCYRRRCWELTAFIISPSPAYTDVNVGQRTICGVGRINLQPPVSLSLLICLGALHVLNCSLGGSRLLHWPTPDSRHRQPSQRQGHRGHACDGLAAAHERARTGAVGERVGRRSVLQDCSNNRFVKGRNSGKKYIEHTSPAKLLNKVPVWTGAFKRPHDRKGPLISTFSVLKGFLGLSATISQKLRTSQKRKTPHAQCVGRPDNWCARRDSNPQPSDP